MSAASGLELVVRCVACPRWAVMDAAALANRFGGDIEVPALRDTGRFRCRRCGGGNIAAQVTPSRSAWRAENASMRERSQMTDDSIAAYAKQIGTPEARPMQSPMR